MSKFSVGVNCLIFLVLVTLLIVLASSAVGPLKTVEAVTLTGPEVTGDSLTDNASVFLTKSAFVFSQTTAEWALSATETKRTPPSVFARKP